MVTLAGGLSRGSGLWISVDVLIYAAVRGHPIGDPVRRLLAPAASGTVTGTVGIGSVLLCGSPLRSTVLTTRTVKREAAGPIGHWFHSVVISVRAAGACSPGCLAQRAEHRTRSASCQSGSISWSPSGPSSSHRVSPRSRRNASWWLTMRSAPR